MTPSSQLAPRRIGWLNGRGLWTLYQRETRRFLNVAAQTLLAPVITTLLYLLVFLLAFQNRGLVPNHDYAQFMAPGLIVMAMVQNAFANTSSSLLIAKLQGNIVDILMPPLSALELTLGVVAGGITRGLLVALCVGLALWPFVPLQMPHLWAVTFYSVNASCLMALLGMLGGIWSAKFDHMAAVTNFVITPLSFLSGTFYSIDRLPEGWAFVAHVNPFFYMIDGVRYGFLGTAEGSLAVGAALLLACNGLLALAAYRAFATGWRLKS